MNTCYHVPPNCVSKTFQPNINWIFIFLSYSTHQPFFYSERNYLIQGLLTFLVRLFFLILIQFYWKLIKCKPCQDYIYWINNFIGYSLSYHQKVRRYFYTTNGNSNQIESWYQLIESFTLLRLSFELWVFRILNPVRYLSISLILDSLFPQLV